MYEAMDLFNEHVAEVEQNVFFETANLFNLTVDLIFYDTNYRFLFYRSGR